ncbi:probable E3 ubiquitin-protein ligase RNF217 [Macadamia integrifolia]|uniref:probable E3 ubiquitin-protein ligase RNF217 n=1 Tax=Macadamia integrifolia TaxID=60698 RepID=UPI001C4F6870|nr:probable E3 ubiquitin-protein ligase RNF217 [Macadamia integrifolia]
MSATGSVYDSMEEEEEVLPISATSSFYHSMEEEEEEGLPSLTCEICIEPMRENNKFNNGNKCSHPFCLDCIVKYIEAKMEDNNRAEVSCPASNCDNLLDPLSCRSILPADLFVRWCDVLCEFSVQRFDQSMYCPFPECSTLVLSECEGDIYTRTECPNCKKLFCFKCKIPWHVGFVCSETEQLRDENDILFGELVERNKWMKCPGCNFRVEKIEGCPNITCRCGVLFCYKCGKIKSACECYRENVPARRVGTYIGNERRGCVDSRIFKFIFNLLINVIFIGLIVGLDKIKGSKAAHIISTILLYIYYIFVFPMSGYALCQICCCCGRR